MQLYVVRYYSTILQSGQEVKDLPRMHSTNMRQNPGLFLGVL